MCLITGRCGRAPLDPAQPLFVFHRPDYAGEATRLFSCRTRCQSRRRSLHRTRRQLKMRRRLERHPFLRPFRCRLTTPDRPPEPIVAGCWPAWRRSAGFPGAARSKPAEADRRRAGSRRVCVGSGTHPAGAGAAKLIACRPAEMST